MVGIARDLLEDVKAKHPDLTYADIYTFAGAYSIEMMGGPNIPWKAGRTDAAEGEGVTPDGRLPDAGLGAEHLRDVFYRMGFDDREIVALSGVSVHLSLSLSLSLHLCVRVCVCVCVRAYACAYVCVCASPSFMAGGLQSLGVLQCGLE